MEISGALIKDGLGVAESGVMGRTPFGANSEIPTEELNVLLSQAGSILFPFQPALGSYILWSHRVNLFDVLDGCSSATISDVCRQTIVSESGADALLGVLCALKLVVRDGAGGYSLTGMAREYCLRRSPYFVADQFGSPKSIIPPRYLNRPMSGSDHEMHERIATHPVVRFGTEERLRNQHARNLPYCVSAVKTGEFENVRCLIDIGGGSGPFAIPLALEYPKTRITIAELPDAIPNIRKILLEHGLEERIDLLAFDALSDTWPIPICDGMFIGNVLHGFDDSTCRRFCQKAYRCLGQGGKLWIHELTWNIAKDGPLIAALLNASMRSGGSGRQRTAQELTSFLEEAGFVDTYVVPTAGAFSLSVGTKQ